MASSEGGGKARTETRLAEDMRVRSIFRNFMMMLICEGRVTQKGLDCPSSAVDGSKEELGRRVVGTLRWVIKGDKRLRSGSRAPVRRVMPASNAVPGLGKRRKMIVNGVAKTMSSMYEEEKEIMN